MYIYPQEALPKYLRDMFSDAKNHPNGKRRRETEIMNSAFDMKADGTLTLNLEKPMFQPTTMTESGAQLDRHPTTRQTPNY